MRLKHTSVGSAEAMFLLVQTLKDLGELKNICRDAVVPCGG